MKTKRIRYYLLNNIFARITINLTFLFIFSSFSFIGYAQTSTIELTEYEHDWLKAHPDIKMVGDPNWLPFEAFNNNDKYIGIVSEYIKLIENQLKIHIEIIPTKTWTESVNLVKTGEVDIISETDDSDLKEYLLFSKSYLSNPVVIVMGNKENYVESIDNILDKKIAIIKNYGYASKITKKYSDIDYLIVNNIQDGLMAVSTGKADAMFCTMALGSYTISQMGLYNIKVVGKTEFQTKLAFGIRKDYEPLVSIFNKGINNISQTEKRAISERWTPSGYVEKTDYSLVFKIGGVLFLFLIVFLYWNLLLEKKVKLRTEELELSQQNLIEKNEELHKSKEKAEESNQLKTEFINNMSHEIRTPLNGILGFSDFIKNPNLTNEKRIQYADIIQNSGNQLLLIIEAILEISKLGTKQEKVSESNICINNLFSDLFSIFEIKAKEKGLDLSLIKGLSDKESSILTDKTKLYKILSNLLENALKFTNAGSIEFGYKIIEETMSNASIQLYVKDTGIGIKPEGQEIIFERFSQEEKSLERNVGGLGLGLSIAKENAELLGGKITVLSEKEKGSTFFVTIPYKPVNAEQEKNNAQKSSIENRKSSIEKYTILIVEDEEMNYFYLETLLEDFELNLITLHAKHGKEAVEMCKENAEIDFVLMDMKMPIMTGFEATKIIKEFRPDLPIVAQTAYSTKEEKEQAFSAGCDDFISKPISKKTLNEIINKYLITSK